MDFSGRVVIVSGAGGNLGAAVMARLELAGAKLALVNKSPLDAALAGENRLLLDGVDARKRADCARVVDETMARFGRIDALINTVGGFKTAPLGAGASDDWAAMMEMNALSALLLTEAVLPAMQGRKYGRIVHTAAGAGAHAFAGASAYAASKAALMRVVEAAAEENRGKGVTVNCVMPSIIDTPQNRAAMPKADVSTWVKAEAIAEVMVFLASRAASGVTGASIPVTGAD